MTDLVEIFSKEGKSIQIKKNNYIFNALFNKFKENENLPFKYDHLLFMITTDFDIFNSYEELREYCLETEIFSYFEQEKNIIKWIKNLIKNRKGMNRYRYHLDIFFTMYNLKNIIEKFINLESLITFIKDNNNYKSFNPYSSVFKTKFKNNKEKYEILCIYKRNLFVPKYGYYDSFSNEITKNKTVFQNCVERHGSHFLIHFYHYDMNHEIIHYLIKYHKFVYFKHFYRPLNENMNGQRICFENMFKHYIGPSNLKDTFELFSKNCSSEKLKNLKCNLLDFFIEYKTFIFIHKFCDLITDFEEIVNINLNTYIDYDYTKREKRETLSLFCLERKMLNDNRIEEVIILLQKKNFYDYKNSLNFFISNHINELLNHKMIHKVIDNIYLLYFNKKSINENFEIKNKLVKYAYKKSNDKIKYFVNYITIDFVSYKDFVNLSQIKFETTKGYDFFIYYGKNIVELYKEHDCQLNNNILNYLFFIYNKIKKNKENDSIFVDVFLSILKHDYFKIINNFLNNILNLSNIKNETKINIIELLFDYNFINNEEKNTTMIIKDFYTKNISIKTYIKILSFYLKNKTLNDKYLKFINNVTEKMNIENENSPYISELNNIKSKL